MSHRHGVVIERALNPNCFAVVLVPWRPHKGAMTEESATLANRLGDETSPYLQQHRDNPVAWQPWDEAALARAKAENKPILLSIGYAACHWCHVMAHESFEDPETAAVMNALFVNIKVDREERPDLDTIYQSALALLGEHGGWPLTMFLTPAGEPFWGGTYFPPSPRFGRPGFTQVLEGIAQAYAREPETVAQNVKALKEALAKLSQNQSGDEISLAVSGEVARHLCSKFDRFEGGIEGAPKFPQPQIMKLLWRTWRREGEEPLRQAVELTLTKMCQGGIYDHLGGGFARYSTDPRWLAPHFEKMLYDNAQLLQCLAWAWQVSGNPLYEARIRETVAWVLREMMAERDHAGGGPCGAFAATLDADSEGEEGKFYVWDAAEIDRLLGEDAAFFRGIYDVTPQGNWEGKTILNRSQDPALGNPEIEAHLADLRAILLAARETRVRPGWDDKVLADWNGLMIAALAELAPLFGEPDWLAAAETAFAFVAETMLRDGRLMHTWRRGKLQNAGLLDDYANMTEAALALYEATGEPGYLARAEAWVERLDEHFWDPAAGGYFLTADDTEALIVRTKNAHDSAVPSGNGVMLGALARLHALTGKAAYRERGEALARAFAGELQRNIFPLATLLNGNELLQRAQQIVVVGPDAPRQDPGVQALLAVIHGTCLPNRVLQVIGPDETLPEGHPARGKGRVEGRATVYVCQGQTCSLPITDPEALELALGG